MEKRYCSNNLNIRKDFNAFISPLRVITMENIYIKREIIIEALWLYLLSLNTNNKIVKINIGFKYCKHKSLLGRTFSISIKQ